MIFSLREHHFPQPGQQCTTSCTKTSQSVQKSFWHVGHLYRPKGLMPSVAFPAPIIEAEGSLNGIEHPWHFLLGVSPSVIDILCSSRSKVKVCPAGIIQIRERKKDVHGRKRFHREQMVIASRQMGRAHNHQSADVAICRNIAHLRQTAGTQVALAFQLRVAYT